MQTRTERRQEGMHKRRTGLWLALFTVLMVVLFLHAGIGTNPVGHSDYDSYTLQALRWKQGKIALGEPYSWLELAEYQGDYYVSFPPLPAVPMLVVSLFTGAKTPSNLVVLIYFLLSTAVAYLLSRRLGFADASAGVMAVFITLGSNMLHTAVSGGVWYMAQHLSFLLTLLAAYGLCSDQPRGWGWGLFALALSVGCRPFQAVYVPFALLLLYQHVRPSADGVWRTLIKMVPYLIAPALFALALGIYNAIRFQNPLEFGHNYLPEFTAAQHGQFSTVYFMENLKNILRWPSIEQGRLSFPAFSGFAFYLANPIFILLFSSALRAGIRKKMDAKSIVLLASILIHLLLLLLHKSLGGWQFGTRYLCDLIPMAALFLLWHNEQKRIDTASAMVMIFAVLFNIYGAAWFWLASMM